MAEDTDTVTPPDDDTAPPSAAEVAKVTAAVSAMASPAGIFELHTEGIDYRVEGAAGFVDVWIQRISPGDWEQCIRHADAARAVVAEQIAKANSEEVRAALGEMISVLQTNVFETNGNSQRVLAEYSAAEEIKKATDECDARLLLDDEDGENRWAKDSYLSNLVERWIGKDVHLSAVFAKTPEPGPDASPLEHEAKFVWDELNEFLAEAYRRRAEAVDLVVQEVIASTTQDEMRDKAVERFINARAGTVWHQVFSRWRAYFTTRLPKNHQVRFFDVYGRPVPRVVDGRVVLDDNDEPVMDMVLGEPALQDGSALLAELVAVYDSKVDISSAEGNELRSDVSSSPPSGLIDQVVSKLSGPLGPHL